ncbi:ankyrin repeat protein [Candidatus Rickettsiella viridis]|uniref:Ankyrin repeat protein n=1 Tax=Candidatus Rickettsiella viridis TaxID=676208 RepID=A0A2Z5UVT1_9COXI|nr:ankyrin repeat domain-containing protein [Candidatus Rickettsiella viridis]BBB15598.1 ankyrin repeat protein [Candidatus Rickettsiella viridis]
MKDIIIRLMNLIDLEPEEKGACHGCGVVALQAFILGTEYQQSYIKRLEKMAQLNSQADDEVLKQELESRDEQGVLKYPDILAHLQTVKLFHSPGQHLEWSDSKTTLRQSEVSTVARIAQSKLAEKRGGIHRVSSFSSVYTYTDMEVYLTSLQKVMETLVHKETRCGLLLSSDKHLIMLAYDAANSSFPWIIDNDATVTRFSSDQYVDIAKKIRKIFTNNTANDKPLILCTAVYSTGDQLAKAKLAVDEWRSNCKVIHQVTAEKAKMIGIGGVTWLFRAAETGHTETIKLLLENGADINVVTDNKRTPLYVAAENGHADTVQFLLGKKRADANAYAYVNAKTKAGSTALHAAAEGGYTVIVELLLKEKADAKAADKYGFTPLHFAVDSGGYPAIAELLLAAGADPDANAVIDGSSYTPRSIARDGKCAKVIKAFEKKGDAEVQVEDNRIHLPVWLQRLFNFFTIASIVSLGMALSFCFFSSMPVLLVIAFTTAIVTAIGVKYLPRVGVGQQNKLESLSKEPIHLCETSITHGLLASPLCSQISMKDQLQQKEDPHLTNAQQGHYNRLSM